MEMSGATDDGTERELREDLREAEAFYEEAKEEVRRLLEVSHDIGARSPDGADWPRPRHTLSTPNYFENWGKTGSYPRGKEEEMSKDG
jgi:hypothetical protein